MVALQKKRSNPYTVDWFWQRVCCKYCHLLWKIWILSRNHNYVLQELPDDKFDITTTLIENLKNEVKEKGSIHHFPNHFNKYTYYYPLIDQILLLEAKYGLDAFKKKEFYMQHYPFTVTRYLHGGH